MLGHTVATHVVLDDCRVLVFKRLHHIHNVAFFRLPPGDLQPNRCSDSFRLDLPEPAPSDHLTNRGLQSNRSLGLLDYLNARFKFDQQLFLSQSLDLVGVDAQSESFSVVGGQSPAVDYFLQLDSLEVSLLLTLLESLAQALVQARCSPERVILVHDSVERLGELVALAVCLEQSARLKRVDPVRVQGLRHHLHRDAPSLLASTFVLRGSDPDAILRGVLKDPRNHDPA